MAYVTQSELETRIPAPHLNDALDDDRDGTADDGVLDAVIAAASQDVDGFLAGRFSVPFDDPAPAAVRSAAYWFTLEAIYDRRPYADKNPFKDRADWWRKRLQAIGQGEPLDATIDPEFTPGAAIVEDVDINDTLR